MRMSGPDSSRPTALPTSRPPHTVVTARERSVEGTCRTPAQQQTETHVSMLDATADYASGGSVGIACRAALWGWHAVLRCTHASIQLASVIARAVLPCPASPATPAHLLQRLAQSPHRDQPAAKKRHQHTSAAATRQQGASSRGYLMLARCMW